MFVFGAQLLEIHDCFFIKFIFHELKIRFLFLTGTELYIFMECPVMSDICM